MFKHRTTASLFSNKRRLVTARRASILIILLALLGATWYIPAAVPVAEAAGPSIYWGALVKGLAPSAANLQPGGAFDTFETRSKKKMSIIHWGQAWVGSDGSWGEFQTSYFDNVRNHGAIPMLNWCSWRLGGGVNQPNFQLRDIYGGMYDTYITRWATAAKSWGHPLFLRFNHEMNGWWYPWAEGKLSDGTIVNGNSAGDVVKAWRHVHDIFTNVGATNVTWVWSPNQIGNNSRYPALSSLYPGSSYVDWTGLSIYNKYSTWLGVGPLMTGSDGQTWLKNSYSEVVNVSSGKPMMLAEWGTYEAGDGGAKKAAWIKDALLTQIPTNFPKIKAVVWFNWDAGSGESIPIETSQASIDAWAAGIASSTYATNQYASLNTSPIPALATTTSAASTALAAVADTYIDASNLSSTAGGTSATLHADSDPIRKTFLRFDLSSLAGRTITSVKLRVKTTADAYAGSVNGFSVKAVTDVQWKEAYLSYSNAVAISSTVLGTIPANTAASTWYEITLPVSAIQPKVGGLLSLAIEAGGSDGLQLSSRETADKPQLLVSYS
ncbi:MAG: hypothetical protein IPO81_28690 [Kouleothrix sp.]|nr:hypothetical protein [Kouleothrix sp.]